jgi:hypothetical protein
MIMYRLIVSLLVVLIMAGCGKKEEPKVVEEPTPVTVDPGATVNFVKGEVKTFASGAWKTVAINDHLLLKDSLDLIAKSELEVKPDSGDAVKLAGPQKGVLGDIIIKIQQAAKEKETSKTISAIKKIQGTKQTLTTQTPTAVAGIRGTAGRKTVPPDTTKQDSTSQ